MPRAAHRKRQFHLRIPPRFDSVIITDPGALCQLPFSPKFTEDFSPFFTFDTKQNPPQEGRPLRRVTAADAAEKTKEESDL